MQKNRLANWLYQINAHDIPVNNWQFFRVLVNLALKKAGMKYSEEKLNDALGNIEEMYIGNGWYTDGHTHRCDYYISFAIHFYSLIYALVMRDEDKERSKEFINRAERFGKDFIYWFSENSEAVPYGRSLTYRFAQISFWSACLISGAKPFDYGVIKGIISRHMSDWAAAPICDNSGTLTTGYKYPNMHMTEWYNASGSPYWAFKAFAILMLPDNHLFWKVDPKPMPELEGIKFIPEARMLITRTESSVCMFVPGLQDDENFGYSEWKYSKFAYSTAFGFSVPRGMSSPAATAPDSMLAFELGGSVFAKNLIRECRISDSAIFMKTLKRQ
ncbi:MAG: DUF2264 domain-containing protein [Clostridia bacterium]|nr:DUF2264 domain-containing protein [Clostridia bacterium]